jgi:hypothetical protein
MPNVIEDASKWLTGMQVQHTSNWVSYRRGSLTHPCIASATSSTVDVVSANGIVQRWELRDFVISLDQMPFPEPMAGDVIIEAKGTVVLSYEVLSPPGLEVWKWDNFRTAFKIHSRLVQEQ